MYLLVIWQVKIDRKSPQGIRIRIQNAQLDDQNFWLQNPAYDASSENNITIDHHTYGLRCPRSHSSHE